MNVLVTGGCGLMGSAFVKALADRGDSVLIADVDEEAGSDLEDELSDKQVIFRRCDVTEPPEVDDALDLACREFGSIDACVHAAYPYTSEWGTPFEDLDIDDLSKNLEFQLGSAIMVSQRAVKRFRDQGQGHLVHVASIQGISAPKFSHYEGLDMNSPIEYSAIKSGVISITKYLAKYLSGSEIRVNCISPGGIEDGQPADFLHRYKSDCTSKGMLSPDDLVGTLLFLLSEESRYINGQNIVVDDGWSL